MTERLQPFHLAMPVNNLDEARSFYCETLGCTVGRTASRWIDLNFFGHQVTLHLVDDHDAHVKTNAVDGDNVPARHFGIVLTMEDWKSLASKLRDVDCEFLISPHVRFQGELGEQTTMFLRDPSGNALEFKSFADQSQLFAH